MPSALRIPTPPAGGLLDQFLAHVDRRRRNYPPPIAVNARSAHPIVTSVESATADRQLRDHPSPAVTDVVVETWPWLMIYRIPTAPGGAPFQAAQLRD